MFDFASLHQEINPTVKKIKLEQINSLHEDDQSRTVTTAKVHYRTNLPPEQPISYLSLRQKFSGLTTSNLYPLPRKYDMLLSTMKSIESNFWKKKSVLQFDTVKHSFEIMQIGQLLKLDQEIYQINQTEKGIELRLQSGISENLPLFQQFRDQLPIQMEQRINKIRQRLDDIVQLHHKAYLKIRNLEDFQEFSDSYKVYHPEFDMQCVEDIQPIQLNFQVFNKQQQEQMTNLIKQIIAFYTLRTVSCIFYANLIAQMQMRLPQAKDQLESQIVMLTKCLPDFIQISNKSKELTKAKWIVQINKNLKEVDVVHQFNQLFY